MLENMQDRESRAALKVIKNAHCHSDIGDLLYRVGLQIDGVSCDTSMGRSPFPSIALLADHKVFAIGSGMKHVTLRLSPLHAAHVIGLGGRVENLIGYPNWVNISPFQNGFDLKRWLTVARDDLS